MSRGFKLGVLAAAVMATAPAVQAFEAGDFIVRAGVAHVAPDDSSDVITLSNGTVKPFGEQRVAVDSNSQLGIRGTYMLTSNLGLGLLAATPFKHNITASGGALDGAPAGETKHLPPTLTLQYFPMASSSAFQPFVGLGVNYTNFFEEKTSSALNDNLPGTSSKLDLDDSVGVAVELGMDYMLSENFGLNAAIWWADINTDAQITAYNADGSQALQTDKFEVEIDPMVYMVGFTYKF